MSGAAKRSATGVDPITREIAERMARQSGLSLDEWLAGLRTLDETEAARSTEGPAPGVAASYLETPRRGDTAPARYEAPDHPADEMARMTQAIDRLFQRMEAAEGRASSAIGVVEGSAPGAVHRLDGDEREQIAIAARFEGAVQEIGAEQSKIAERLRRIEQEAHGPRSIEALRALENALGKVAGHLYEGESRTREAIAVVTARVDSLGAGEGRAADVAEAVASRIGERIEVAAGRTGEALRQLQSSFAALDARLASVEADTSGGDVDARLEHLATGEALRRLQSSFAALDARLASVEADSAGGDVEVRLEHLATGEALRRLQSSFAALDARLASVEADTAGDDVDVRLEHLADSLSMRLEAARAEMDTRLRTTTEGRIDQVERGLAQIADHLQTAERRSAEAIERMGREVTDMAGVLARKVQAAETRGAGAIEQVGGEVARIAQAVEAKLGRADTVHAQALERLGEEIARISERLAERIANSDRRAALAIDEVGEQVARSSERASQRQERVSEDLAERIRLSEQRTARVLEEARERLERVAAARQAGEIARQAVAGPMEDAGEPIYGDDPFMAFRPPPPAVFAAASTPRMEPGQAPAFTQADFEAADTFSAPAMERTAMAEPPLGRLDPEDPDPLPESTLAEEPAFGRREEPRFDSAPSSRPSGPTWEVIQKARAAANAGEAASSAQRPPHGTASESEGLFSHRFSRGRKGSGAGNVIMGVGMAAAVGLAMGGFWVVEREPKASAPAGLADLIGAKRSPRDATAASALTAGPPSLPREAVALNPTRIADAGDRLQRLPAPLQDLAPRYAAAVAQIDAKKAQGVESLRRVADLGYAPAQFYLAKLYESGADGLAKDSSEARRWTERAARGGERKAMHNLALYYFEGTGGPRDSSLAAEWFRRAADQGLADSQFNLGRLYEQGLGVQRNPAEAYKWYLIAAKSGDAEARAGAARTRTTLTIEARVAAERSAAAFHTSPAVQMAIASLPPTPGGDLVTAQKALLALGYYQGPVDGAPSPALRLALSAYQQDQGLPNSGAPDPATIGKLSALTR